jgi:hypothetical protein
MLPESLCLLFEILVQNMNINKNVDSINSLKYVLSSCNPRSRPSTFLLSWPIFRATLVSIMSPPIGTPIFRATPDSTISPPIGTQLSIGPCDTSCASCRFHNPSSKSMRNAIHHLFTTLVRKNNSNQTERTNKNIYIHTTE